MNFINEIDPSCIYTNLTNKNIVSVIKSISKINFGLYNMNIKYLNVNNVRGILIIAALISKITNFTIKYTLYTHITPVIRHFLLLNIRKKSVLPCIIF